jgi:hypothetical protein
MRLALRMMWVVLLVAPTVRGQQAALVVFNVKDFGARGDGVTDDGPALMAVARAVNQRAAVKSEIDFPPGTYAINAHDTASQTPSNALIYITAANVAVVGIGSAQLRLMVPQTPYSEQFSGRTGGTFYWNYLRIAVGGSVTGMEFNSNGATETRCSAEFGCFWATAIYTVDSHITVDHNKFIALEGWAVLAQGSDITITHNYAEKSKGMVCAAVDKPTSGCVISGNVSMDSEDAPYAANGEAGANVSHFTIDHNAATGNNNGAGIDITAAKDGVVTGNVIAGMKNWCIQVDKNGGAYTRGRKGTYVPSMSITVEGNTCNRNNAYKGWPIDAEIVVGDNYPVNGYRAFKPGDTADGITIRNNRVIAGNDRGMGVAVGYGAANVTIERNTISGCGQGGDIPCGPVYGVADFGESTNVKILNNHQDGQYPKARMLLKGKGPYDVRGNNFGPAVSPSW